MPRKKNKRKALQAFRRKLEGGGIKLPNPYYPAHRISPPSDMAMAVAMAFAAPRMVMGIDRASGDDESVVMRMTEKESSVQKMHKSPNASKEDQS